MEIPPIDGQLQSTTPIKGVQSRHSGTADQQQSRKRLPHNPDLDEEQNEPDADDPHVLDEQA